MPKPDDPGEQLDRLWSVHEIRQLVYRYKEMLKSAFGYEDMG